MTKKRQKVANGEEEVLEMEENMQNDTGESESANINFDGADEESSEGASVDDDDSNDELMNNDLDDAEIVDFDFEALPPHKNDKEGIINMLTQVFLRADIDVEAMAQTIIGNSPMGCVYLPAEDNADEGNENVVYGLLSMIPLGCTEKYETDIWSLLISRAKKYALDKSMVSKLESLSRCEDSRVRLLINERMLHFPSAVAPPAFSSLRKDLIANEKANAFTVVIMIMKVRIADVSEDEGSSANKGKRKLGKAEKKRNQVAATYKADIIFDNKEERLLFEDTEGLDYFQYPVQSDVEKDSKFNATVIRGVTYRPYRRVCILQRACYDRYMDIIASCSTI